MAFYRIKYHRSFKGGIPYRTAYIYYVKSVWDKERNSPRQVVLKYIGRCQSLEKYNEKEVFERDEYACRLCGKKEDLTIDHIIPLIKGGTSKLSNLQVLCIDCNLKKGVNTPSEMKRVVFKENHL